MYVYLDECQMIRLGPKRLSFTSLSIHPDDTLHV